MKIDENNIEAYLVDYQEGRLSDAESRAVEAFLEAEDKNFSLTDFSDGENEKFCLKDELKHTSEFDFKGEKYFDRLAVSVSEGVAAEDEIAEFQRLVSKNPKLERDAFLFSKCRLTPDENIIFKDKASLKHLVIIPWKSIISVAAAVLAGVFLTVFLTENKTISGVYTVSREVSPRQAYTVVSEEKPAPVKKTPRRFVKEIKEETYEETEIAENQPVKTVTEKEEVLQFVSRDFSSLRVENPIRDEKLTMPKTFDFQEKTVAEKSKTRFMGGKLIRYIKRVNLEIERDVDGKFTALVITTPNKMYSLEKVN